MPICATFTFSANIVWGSFCPCDCNLSCFSNACRFLALSQSHITALKSLLNSTCYRLNVFMGRELQVSLNWLTEASEAGLRRNCLFAEKSLFFYRHFPEQNPLQRRKRERIWECLRSFKECYSVIRLCSLVKRHRCLRGPVNLAWKEAAAAFCILWINFPVIS